MAKQEVYTDTFHGTPLESVFRTSKKTIQEYVREIDRHCRFKSVQSQAPRGYVLDDRSRLIDLYEACVQQDAHLKAVLETVMSQIIGERYILAKLNKNGKYVKDVEESKKIQGTQFNKIIRGIVESNWYGYTLLEIMPGVDERTGRLQEVNIVERRNILPNQQRVVQQQGMWSPGWDLFDPQYHDNYVLINNDDLGLFSSTTPLILAKKFTVANYVNFSHTYGQPIIHGKAESESIQDRQRMASDIANAAQNKIIVTGLSDQVDVKTFAMSNSEQIYTSLINFTNKEVSNLIVGSGSMAGEQQSYVGSTAAHEDIFRERIEMYRKYIENVMNEEIIPRLVKMGFIKAGLEFKYAKHVEMSNKDKISLYSFITDKYEVSSDEIEKEFGIVVGKQLNAMDMGMGGLTGGGAPGGDDGGGGQSGGDGYSRHASRHLTDQQYVRRYGHPRTEKQKSKKEVTNFLTEG